ncbi:MAG: beta-ketoacyl-[acyl-carrier-protein] synthase family protein [Planctomycetaceae bacterium]
MSNSSDAARRVVITGIGVVSPIGIGLRAFADNLSAGKSGIGVVRFVEHLALPGNVAGEVREFSEDVPKEIFGRLLEKKARTQMNKSLRLMCREIQLGVTAAMLSLEDAGIKIDPEADNERLGVDFGANLMSSPPSVLKDACWSCTDEELRFHFDEWGDKGLAKMEPLWLLKYLPNMPACHIGIAARACGPNNSITLAEASGMLALGEAYRVLSRGHADTMIAGTTGTRVHPVKSMHAKLWDELATGDGPPETWYRPFDANRSGQVVGEGACAFILENEETALARGANVLGRVLGAGSSCVLDKQGRPGTRQALVNAMRAALRDAGLEPADIGHINAHGLGSRESDLEEARAIHDVFGELGSKVPVTALKGYFGNSGSGCGPLELAGSIVGLHAAGVPPTLNYDAPDPVCDLNVVHGGPLPVENRRLLKINVTGMGQASAAIVEVA